MPRGGRQESLRPGAGCQHGQRTQGPRDQEQGDQARQGEGGGRDGDPGVGGGALAGLLHVRDDRADQHQPGESAHRQEGQVGGGGESRHRDVSVKMYSLLPCFPHQSLFIF